MLARYFMVSLITFIIAIFFIENTHLVLVFYVLFPVFLIPYFYTSEHSRNPYSLGALALIGAAYLFYLFRFMSFEMCLLGIGQGLIFTLLTFYQSVWKSKFAYEEKVRQTTLREFDSFRGKYQSRLASLHHLEKQVAGLLDLFEIARDFSEYLSYGGVASILQKRVRPHFSFSSMRVLVLEKKEEGVETTLRFVIDADHVTQTEDLLGPEEKSCLDRIKASHAYLEQDGRWAFPLLIDPAFCSFLMVEGTQPDDLAKFEVLSAFLTLQVKKIRLYDTVKELAIRDSLTGVFLRRHFLERFEEEVKRSIKHKLSLAVLMLDIDHFKRYNDEHGHLSGDVALKQVAEILIKNLRKVDIVARYGGEEFIVLIPETTADIVLEVAERIRSHVARNTINVYNATTRVTLSIGAAVFPDSKEFPMVPSEGDTSQIAVRLIRQADKALYQAKEEGRNQVVLFRE